MAASHASVALAVPSLRHRARALTISAHAGGACRTISAAQPFRLRVAELCHSRRTLVVRRQGVCQASALSIPYENGNGHANGNGVHHEHAEVRGCREPTS